MGKRKYYWGIGVVLLIGIASLIFSGPRMSGYAVLGGFSEEITIYKSSSCGCCEVYGSYFKREGNSNTDIVNAEDSDSIKRQFGVPSAMQSCHTTVIGDYFVEGHIPLEAVEKMMAERPDIAGIAMPGMPSGSPGMPGPKTGDFIIYAVNHDGSYGEFMRM